MFSKFSVKRPVTITMIILIVVLFGTVSLSRLPLDLLPDIEYPVAVVQTAYSGVGPEEIENLVTRPLEEGLSTTENIDTITSISSEGSSLIIMQYDFGVDMDSTTFDMREKIDLVDGYLPEDATEPMVFKFDPNSMPVMFFSINGEGNITTTQKIAEDIIKPRLERIEGAASVEIFGGSDEEVEVRLIEERCEGFGITINYLSQILGAENLNLPGGEVSKGNNNLTVRTVGKFESIEEIRNLNIPLPKGGIVRLKDIADVNINNKEKSSITRLDGENILQVAVMKQSGINTVNISRKINKELEQIKKEYPDLEIVTIMDQAEYINDALSNVMRNGIIGALLAVLVLYIFLRNIKTTVVIGLSIPISIITTFILLYLSGVTLNMMTLGGLALGIGMLVDNSIVVLENIYRHRVEGVEIKESAISGANEVSTAVSASTFTTVAVFMPIIFVQGLTAIIFKEFAMTIILSLLSSLIVSLTLVPMMSSKLLSVSKKEKTNEKARKESKITKRYKNILSWSLRHRIIVIIISIVVFVGSIGLVVSMGAEFFPKTDQGQITISASLPIGAELEDTAEITKEINEKIIDIPEIDKIFSSIGSSGMSSMMGNQANISSITVMLVDLDKRKLSSEEVADVIRKRLRDVPGAEMSVTSESMSMGGLGGGGVSVSITGNDLYTLKAISSDFEEMISEIDGTREITNSMSEGTPEVQILIDRSRASQYGLTTAQIASGIKSTLSGTTATRFDTGGSEIDVVLKGDEIYSESLSNLEMIKISTPLGTTVPLSQVADIEVAKGPIQIYRENQSRLITVGCEVFGRDIQSVTSELMLKIQDYDMPRGYTYSFGGETELINDAFKDLLLALLLAIVLVYMILAAQFESLLYPLSIMLSVPLALSGGALGLFIAGVPLSVPAIIGFIVLVGIVVNNAIVLVDYINRRRKNKEERTEAIMNAGPIRLRPIMMTALTTILALLPMALGIGEGTEMTRPLAVTVVGGLLVGTLITLIIIPVVYTIFDDIASFFKRKFSHKVEA